MFSNPRKYLPHMHTKNPLINEKLFMSLEICSYLQVLYTCKLFNRWIKQIDLVSLAKILLKALEHMFEDRRSWSINQEWLYWLILEYDLSKSLTNWTQTDFANTFPIRFIRNCTTLRNKSNKPYPLSNIRVVIDRIRI